MNFFGRPIVSAKISRLLSQLSFNVSRKAPTSFSHYLCRYRIIQSLFSHRRLSSLVSSTLTRLKPLSALLHQQHISPYRLHPNVRRYRLLVPFPVTIALTFLTTVKCEDVYCECTNCKIRNASEPVSGPSTNSNSNCTQSPPAKLDCTAQTSASSNYNKPVTEWLETKEMSSGALIKQACILTVDSVTRLLSLVVVAVEDYHNQYRVLLDSMIELMEESRSSSIHQQEILDCKIVILRGRIQDMKKNIIKLETYISSIEKLALDAADTAFLGNAEYQSMAMVERLDSALNEVKRIRTITNNMEKDMMELQSILIIESGKFLKA